MSDPIIQIRNLRKVYKVGVERVVALDNISFSIPAGQVCCIVGTSGSGKSTLLNQLAGLEKPTSGAVIIGRYNISTFSENKLARFRQKNIGFIFQSYNLIPSMTAMENVCLPLIFRGMDKGIREKAARKILAEVGLSGRVRHTPAQMSGGQQQRVGIARAFVANPKIIFADEPTGNLDSRTTSEVMRMMIRLCHQHNQTLVLVTHDPNLARYADRIITIIDGNIVNDAINKSIAYTEPEGFSAAEPDKPEQTDSTAPPGPPGTESTEQPEASAPAENGCNENAEKAGEVSKE